MRRNETSDEVTFLCRGTRWQIPFSDDAIRSRDNYVMNGFVAIHSWIELPLEDTERLNRLFQSEEKLQQMLRQKVTGELKEQLTSRNYRQAMYDAPAIVAALNELWKNDPQLADYRELIHVCFTALTIRPREEAERPMLDIIGAKMMRVTDELRWLEVQEDNKKIKRKQQFDDWSKEQATAVEEFTLQVVKALNDAAKSLHGKLPSLGHHIQATDAVKNIFSVGRNHLANRSADVVSVINRLSTLMNEVNQECRTLQDQMDQLTAGGGSSK